MAGISVSGLISNSFDWKSIVDQLITIDSAPIAKLQTEESTNIDRLAAFSSLQTKLTELKTASTALSSATLFSSRTATGASWSTTVANDAATGSYTIDVTQLATNARLNGKSSISTQLNAAASDYDALLNPNGIAGLTLASLPTSSALTAGTFTVNGQQVTVALTDSLQDVFDRIDALGGDVAASYNGTTDKLSLTSSSEIVLGAANDTSNFLSVMRLANNGGSTITSTSSLGAASTKVPLDSARLRGAFASGAGTFAVNGVSIAYDTTTDSMTDILARITASTAGVSATYDSAKDRVILTNKATGDSGVGVTDTGGGTLAAALGLTTGTTLVRGKNAEFSLNGSDLVSASNTLDESVTGIAGLAVQVDSVAAQTVTVAPDAAGMTTAIQNFITKFNAVQSYIDTQTKITTSADGKVTAATLASNHEVGNWSSELRALAFSQVSGLTGSITRLDALGLDFSSTDSTLSIKDSAKLTAALTNNSADVGAYFNTSTTGFASKFTDYLTRKLDTHDGPVQLQMNTLNKQNTAIEAQIATLNSRLADERERLTTSFLAMQTAQSTAQTQLTTLTNMFSTKSSSSS